MPIRGESVVPENHWFIWPELAIVQGNVAAAPAEAAFLRMSDVDQTQFVGKPFRRWFWRRQLLP
jgi:hypothetical protein